MDPERGSAFVRDWALVTLLAGALIGLGSGVDVAALQLPAYFLILGFDLVQALVGAWIGFEAVQFGAYLGSLGLLAAGLGHIARTRSPESDVAGWRLAVAAFAGLLGGLALAFAASVFVGSAQREPVAIAGATGLLGLALASWLAGLLDVQVGPTESGQ